MQRVVIISGKKGEGKTTELMNDYFDHYTAVSVLPTGVKNTRDLIRPVIISLQEDIKNNKNILAIYIDDFIRNDGNGVYPKKEEFLDGNHELAYGCNIHNASIEVEAIKQIIDFNLEKYGDCTFYIDNIHLLGENAVSMITTLVNEYPNDVIDNSFDVYCTMLNK